uniref:Uncharacterized protein n=1 Tax=Panagrolaimus sp. ES5 TaxID=591445 RepID=A0AC34GGJ9_9BILA
MSPKKMSESSESSEFNNTYEVDAILADRYYRGTREFRVR